MDNYTPFAGEGGTYASSSEKYGVLDLPTALDPNTVDLGSLAPLYGLKGDPNYEPDYLDYNMKGRGLAEKYPYNSGYMYLLGMIAGGVYGAVQGNRFVGWKEISGVVISVCSWVLISLSFSELLPQQYQKFE